MFQGVSRQGEGRERERERKRERERERERERKRKREREQRRARTSGTGFTGNQSIKTVLATTFGWFQPVSHLKCPPLAPF